MTLVRVDKKIFRIPDFVRNFGDPEPHTCKGSLLRHIAVEKILYKLRQWLVENDAMPGYNILNAIVGLLFGLNCNFSIKDLALYFAWSISKNYYDVLECSKCGTELVFDHTSDKGTTVAIHVGHKPQIFRNAKMPDFIWVYCKCPKCGYGLCTTTAA